MINSKQRAQLRAMANSLDTILQIGKGGITDNIVTQAKDALSAREIIKCRVLETSMLSAREAMDELCRACDAQAVQAIGSRFVLYKENRKLEKSIKLI